MMILHLSCRVNLLSPDFPPERQREQRAASAVIRGIEYFVVGKSAWRRWPYCSRPVRTATSTCHPTHEPRRQLGPSASSACGLLHVAGNDRCVSATSLSSLLVQIVSRSSCPAPPCRRSGRRGHDYVVPSTSGDSLISHGNIPGAEVLEDVALPEHNAVLDSETRQIPFSVRTYAVGVHGWSASARALFVVHPWSDDLRPDRLAVGAVQGRHHTVRPFIPWTKTRSPLTESEPSGAQVGGRPHRRRQRATVSSALTLSTARFGRARATAASRRQGRTDRPPRLPSRTRAPESRRCGNSPCASPSFKLPGQACGHQSHLVTSDVLVST